jgi:hypothetical protein
MNAEERAAFYQEISNRGILIFLREDNEEGTYCASKVGTQADPSPSFPAGGLETGVVLAWYSVPPSEDNAIVDPRQGQQFPQQVLFSNRGRAEAYVRFHLNWDWKPEVLAQAPQIVVGPPAGRFSSFMMFDTGFGPQNIELGTIEADDPALAQSIAEGRAREHFAQYLPKEDFDHTKKSIRIRPLLP